MSLSSPTSNPRCTLPTRCSDPTSCPDCSELEDITRQLSALTKRQAAIFAGVNARRDPMSSKFPPEVASYIFEEYVRLHQVNPPPKFLPLSDEVPTDIPQHFNTFHRSAALRLGSVCQKWRQIAWSNPNLWNSLFVCLDTPGHIHGAQLVTEWLTRSKTLPLDIKLDRGYELDESEQRPQSPFDSAVAVVESISRFSIRWRSLDIMRVDPRITIYLDGDALNPDADLSQPARLQYLAASRYEDDFCDSLAFLYNAKRDYYPTHLVIDWARTDHLVEVDFSRLTHLHLKHVCASGLWALITQVSQSSARLLHLIAREIDDVQGLYSTYSGFGHSSMITLPTLHSLSVTANSWERAGDVLNHLKFPALGSLHYTAQETAFSADVICSLIQRSGCALHHLILEDATDSEQNLSAVLHAVPALERLTVLFRERNQESWLFSRLSTGNRLDCTSGTLFLPLLRQLHITSLCHLGWESLSKGSPLLLGDDLESPLPRLQLDSVEFVWGSSF